MVIKLGIPPFPAALTENGTFLAKIEHVWHSARRYALLNGYEYINSFGVVGVAPT